MTARALLSISLVATIVASACAHSVAPPPEPSNPRVAQTSTASVPSPAPPVAAAPPPGPSSIPGAIPTIARTPPPFPVWPLPRTCDPSDCRLPSGEPGIRCAPDGVCANPCSAGMGPEKGGSFCAKLCRARADCGGDPCTPEGVCDRWPDRRDCSGEFCTLPAGRGGGIKCHGTCVPTCKKGLVLYGGTHCAKPCTRAADCPGGECAEGICGPLCPSEGCPYRWE